MKMFVVGVASSLSVVLVGWIVWAASDSAEASAPVVAQVSQADFDALQRRVMVLERALESIQSAPAVAVAVEKRAPMDRKAVAAVDPVRSDAADPSTPEAVLDHIEPALQEKVGDMVADAVEAERAARHQRRVETMLARVGDRVSNFAEAQSLTDSQKTEMTELLTVYTRKRMELIHEARQNGNFPEAMEKVQAMLGETDEELRGVLDADQFAAYEEDQRESFDRRNRRRRP